MGQCLANPSHTVHDHNGKDVVTSVYQRLGIARLGVFPVSSVRPGCHIIERGPALLMGVSDLRSHDVLHEGIHLRSHRRNATGTPSNTSF